MSTVRDQRTPREVKACVEMRRQHAWPWTALHPEVVHLSEVAGLRPSEIADRLHLPWAWIAAQFKAHGTALPYLVRRRYSEGA